MAAANGIEEKKNRQKHDKNWLSLFRMNEAYLKKPKTPLNYFQTNESSKIDFLIGSTRKEKNYYYEYNSSSGILLHM
jgi:hypothetical protein